jgi:hypothetical protein
LTQDLGLKTDSFWTHVVLRGNEPPGSIKTENFFTRRVAIIFSKSTLARGVSRTRGFNSSLNNETSAACYSPTDCNSSRLSQQ